MFAGGGKNYSYATALQPLDSLTPVLNLRDTVVGFIFFLLLGVLGVFF